LKPFDFSIASISAGVFPLNELNDLGAEGDTLNFFPD
jgi:hypothetical protein